MGGGGEAKRGGERVIGRGRQRRHDRQKIVVLYCTVHCHYGPGFSSPASGEGWREEGGRRDMTDKQEWYYIVTLPWLCIACIK